jgi:opacity protein-like surface antigen
MVKKKILAAMIVFLTVAALGYSNIVSFKVNYVIPRAQSGPGWPDSLWTSEFENMNYTKSNFQDTSFGFAYEYLLTQEFSLVFGLDTFSKNKSGYYKNYVGIQLDSGNWAFPNAYQGDFAPMHRLNISITPAQLSIKIAPFGRRNKLIPYVGAGVGLYLWSIRMQGDIIDFSGGEDFVDLSGNIITGYPIYQVDVLEGENFGKISFGYHVFGGLMIPVANRLTIDFEFKYSNAKGKLTSSFHGFGPFDIGSYQFSLGINYWL